MVYFLTMSFCTDYLPCDEDKELYRENGYFIAQELFWADECDLINEICHKHADDKFSGILQIHKQDPALFDVMRAERVVQMLEFLQGAGPIDGLMSQVLFKEAGSQYATQAWNPHQDNAYPQSPNGLYITINIFLADADRETGTMYVYPGSHKYGLFPFEETVSYREDKGKNPGNAVKFPDGLIFEKRDLTFKKGDTLVLHGNVVHGSYPNVHPTRSRPLFQCTYLPQGEPFIPGKNAKRERISLR